MILATHGANRANAPVVAVGAPGELRRLSFQALGTDCVVQYVVDEAERAARFERDVVTWVRTFEARYSHYRPDSIVGRINAAAGVSWVEVDAEAEQMLNLCASLHQLTGGILDATAGPLLRLWDYRAERPRLPTETEVAEARARVGWAKVRREPGRVFLPQTGMALDFGGFGKEWAVDVVAQIAREGGVRAALIDFGRDLQGFGQPPGREGWHIGLEDPFQPGTVAGSIALIGKKGVASSGDYRRGFEVEGRTYGHIVDPRTGRPVAHGYRQCTVIADSCLKAGALSTAAFVLGVPAGLQLIQSMPGAEGVLVSRDARAQTRGFAQYLVQRSNA